MFSLADLLPTPSEKESSDTSMTDEDAPSASNDDVTALMTPPEGLQESHIESIASYLREIVKVYVNARFLIVSFNMSCYNRKRKIKILYFCLSLYCRVNLSALFPTKCSSRCSNNQATHFLTSTTCSTAARSLTASCFSSPHHFPFTASLCLPL